MGSRRRRRRSTAALVALAAAIALGIGVMAGGIGSGRWPLGVPSPAGVDEPDGSVGGRPEATGEGGADGGASAPGRAEDGVSAEGGTGGDGVSAEDGVPAGPATTWLDVDRLLAADPGCPDPVVGNPVVVGVALAGADGGSGVDAVGDRDRAAEHVAALVNCGGGMGGRPVEVVAVAVGGSALTVREAVADLLVAEPVAVLGPPDLVAATRLVEAVDGRVPLVFPLSVAPSLDDPARGSFLLGPDGATLAAVAARHALDQGWRSAVTFSAGDPGSALAVATFTEWFERGGGAVADGLPLAPGEGGTVDLAGQLDRLGVGPAPRRPPDVIFAGAGGALLGALSRALAGAELDVPLMGIDDRRRVEGGWGSLDGVLVVGREPDEALGRTERFDRSARAVDGRGFADPVAAARAADGVLVVLEAVARAGGGGPPAVAEELGGDWTAEGVAGPLGGAAETGVRSRTGIPVVALEGGRATLVRRLSPAPAG